MLPYRIQVTIDPEPRKARGAVREVLRESHRAQAGDWHHRYAPGHFSRGAAAKYGYRPRSPSYKRRKRAAAKAGTAKPGRRPLVFSGLTELRVRSAGSVKAFPTRATLQLYTPSYIRIRPRGNRPNLAEELLRILRGEGNQLGERFAKKTERGLRRIRAPYSVTIT